MDVVDTFNHLIPSDQLDDSLVIGQNLDCEARNELRTRPKLEDSLKNMLSDKDPMFGCTSAQFNLLENEDPAFPITGSASPASGSTSAGLASEIKAAETPDVKQIIAKVKKHPGSLDDEHSSIQQPKMPTNTLIRGRPGRKPVNRLSKSFLIEKGVKGAQLKKELTLGGRININDLDGGLWLNPSVVLRRLTVTIGGFKIELLPGPSYMHSVEANPSGCSEESLSCGADTGLGNMSEAVVSAQNPVPENEADMDVTEKNSADDPSLGLGPYVNPNDVQTSNGTLSENTCTQESKHDDHSVQGKLKHGSERIPSVKQPHSTENNTTAVGNKSDGKEKQLTEVKTLIKSKQGLIPNKSKDVASCKKSNTIKEQKASQSKPSKIVQRGDQSKTKSPKDKKDLSPLKRPSENPQSEHAAKVQKLHAVGDVKVTPKSPSTPPAVAKKIPSSINRLDYQGPVKQSNPHQTSKVEPVHHSHTGNSFKSSQEGGQEKLKLKKLEKILHKHKSRNSRSISVEEPQLFIPDNAPAVKKETVEEQPANSESVWDGNNCCGLCKQHHNNMFMVGCGRCDDWFHGDCVGLDLAKVREMEEEDQMYVCLKCCEEETKKVEPEPPMAVKPEIQEKTEDPEMRQSTGTKEAAHKTGVLPKHETKNKAPSLASKKPVSVEAIRRSVRDSLKEILIQRLKDSDLDITEERASEVAKKTERELFHLFKDTDNKYKNKYRSLMFNLKDTKNNVLFKRVLKGEISPGNLIRMSPEELASKELAAWRQRENRHTIEMIEKEQREVERRPITKITHKGEIEIESQEPVKVPEPVEIETPPNVTEDSREPPKTPEKKAEHIKTEKDTTSQHKSHLFDLHCKICTGRMAPPVEEASTKVVKVATTVVRRQSTKTEETRSTTLPAVDDDLHLTVLEESFRSAQSGFETKSDHITGRDEEAGFLSSLKTLWRGFIHMHSVAKFVTKAFPVSGILDNLTEDLPDSIQVGGRISPQTVWDYLEKIRATGTKEVCLVRFAPETEEDEISYTLLYAYFSSRRRFGVVSNNLKQVKDMYLIPLSSVEKVPHQLVPFDGPGLENNRSNLLLGLIIRQRPKRDFLPVDVNESARFVPEVKPIPMTTKAPRQTEEDEKLFLSSLTSAHKKETDKPADTTENELVTESSEEPSGTEEPSNQESQKPLRFLPGVLVGWGGELPLLPDVGDKPATTGHDTQKTQPSPKADASAATSKGQTAAAPRFIIKKKEAKPVKAEQESSSPADVSAPSSSSEKDSAKVVRPTTVTLKDKPPDVSTEAFLASLSTAPSNSETGIVVSTNKSSSGALTETEKGATEGNSLLQSESQAAPDQTNGSKPPLSGILKKSSAYSTVGLQKDKEDKATLPDLSSPKPVLSSSRMDAVLPFHQGYLQLSMARHKLEEQSPVAVPPFPSKKNDPSIGQPSAVVTQTVNTPEVHTPQAAFNTQASAPPHNSVMAPAVPVHDSTAPFSLQQQPQVPGSYDCSVVQPDNTFSSPSSEDQNSCVQSAQDHTTEALPGLESQHLEGYSEQSGQTPPLAKDYKRQDEQYIDPWERPRNSEDRDHHGRHGHHRDHHHSFKKNRHHDRERKQEHSHDDKYRDRSRHHGHSDDRQSDRRKERHHSDDYSSRHKDRYRHRRDSDYENGRRSSKDS